jgi:RHH-type proline utilization regulon transcriptional repressor/proline dehydrogenase/delta 1-pyrroline-5-carboxylate dehydrogenase
VLASAFDSAGQRCSALRVLCLQQDIADGVLHMLQGALAELRLGNPADVRVDIGPVIDAEAHAGLEAHVAAMQAGRPRHPPAAACRVRARHLRRADHHRDRCLAELGREQFGPILHVLRYRASELDGLIDAINASGYGLTMGVHTRIDETVERVAARAHVGNLYVNRNIIGAVVGVQPFGGEGLSGTGPKAGGPLYLHRLLARTPGPVLADGALSVNEGDETRAADATLAAFLEWLDGAGRSLLEGDELAALRDRADACRARRIGGLRLALPGPTGEDDSLRFTARGTIAGVAEGTAGVLHQVMAALASGNRLLLADSPAAIKVQAALPEALRKQVAVDPAWFDEALGAVLFDGGETAADALRVRIASRTGPILQLLEPTPDYDLSRLAHERTLSINTAAAGGNASLMAMGA